MRIVLTGGVTGGHIYPAIAIGDRFRAADPECEIIYIASGEPLERKIITKAGYTLHEVSSEPFYRDNLLKMAGTIAKTLMGTSESRRIIRKFKPDAIISTGSYVSVPVVLAGALTDTAVFLHEQNGYPGVSNRFLAKYADKVFLGFEAASAYFKESDKLIYSGNPVRSEFYGRIRSSDRMKLDIPADDFVIVVFGGSLGAETINKIAENLAVKYANKSGISLIWGTGDDYYSGIKAKFESKGNKADNIRIMPYINDMPAMLSACDVCISRSGALSVAETSMAGRVAVFVPSPNVTEDHQYHNAKALADIGGAYIVREDGDDDAVAEHVAAIVADLSENDEMRHRMEECSKSAAPLAATDIIYEQVIDICNQRKTGRREFFGRR